MPAQRAGFTVTMFLIDVSPSMGTLRTVEIPPGPNGEARMREVTRLEWVLEFVMLKVQEMIFHGRKTEQCGVILFGTEGTRNVVNDSNSGYEHVTEFIPIGQPNAQTMTKIKSIKPSTSIGDPIDSIIVGIETQARYLAKKSTWTRKMVLLTDGENPMEIEDWDITIKKMNDLEIQTAIIGVDFDDEYMPFYEENKSVIKRKNEEFYQQFSEGLNDCVMGTAAFALQECSKPDIKTTKSTLMDSKIRIGDVDTRPEEAIELHVKTSKCTAICRPPSMKKYAKRQRQTDVMNVDGEDIYTLLETKTQYVVERDREDRADEAQLNGEDSQDEGNGEDTVEKEDLVRGYKYGASFVPVDTEDDFKRLEAKSGIDICGFFPSKNFRRDWSMGEVQYVWANPKSAPEQVAFSAMVQAMFEKQCMAIARWVGRGDPKMGVMMPRVLENVDCFLWVQVPFADDLRKYTFRSLDQLVSKKGDAVTKHAHLPTDEQMSAMENFVDAMDLMHAGDKDDGGDRLPWFDPVQTYNPAVHRIKQALFHGAITSDLTKNPLPPPHPELTKYFNPPPRVLKRAHDAIKDCKSSFKVKKVPPRTVKRRKDGHVPGEEDEADLVSLAAPILPRGKPVLPSVSIKASADKSHDMDVDSATEDGSDEEPSIPAKKLDSRPSVDGSGRDMVSPAKPQAQAQPETVLLTPARSPASPSTPIDPGRAVGRIVGNTSPLEDFKQNIKEGDVVSQAVHDLGEVIKDIITKPFSSRRHQEMLECLKEMRNVALQEDEISTWNAFLRDLKDACLNQIPSNQEFWAEIQKIGRSMSLISSKEAKKLGGRSDVTEGTAVDFVEEED